MASSWEKTAAIATVVSATVALLAFLGSRLGREEDSIHAPLDETPAVDESIKHAERMAALRIRHRPILEALFSADEEESLNARDHLIASGDIAAETFMELSRLMTMNSGSVHGLENSLSVFIHYIDKDSVAVTDARELLCLEAVFVIHPRVSPLLHEVCPRLGEPKFAPLQKEKQAISGRPEKEEATKLVVHSADDAEITKPRIIYAPNPEYTEVARLARIQGTVVVQAIIDKAGQVREVEVIEGLPLGLSEAAVKTMKSWRFEPALSQGKPVEVYYVLSVNFRLVDSEKGGQAANREKEK